ncbi:unnamed protein product [marine sediment metagenome]|uniref:DUF6883 domain-containing protein n=1 Tax=marine sediment metagenome TaxID=412755 RepID=X0WHV6_9ZZZZ
MTFLPNHENAIIDSSKLKDYILSPTHPIGKFKAIYFKRAGYTDKSWQILERDIREQHLSKDIKEEENTSFGKKYRITSSLKGPDSVIIITSVWIILKGEKFPRLITIIPGGEVNEI